MRLGDRVRLGFALSLACVLVLSAVVAAPPAQALTRPQVTQRAARYASSLGYRIGIAVVDSKTGDYYRSGDADGGFLSASVVKVLIAARLLVEGKLHGDVRRLAYRMITQSDNDAADQLYPMAGSGTLVPWTAHHFHIRKLGSPAVSDDAWGSTRLVPRALAHLYVKYAKNPQVGPWLLNAMHHIHEYSSAGEYQWWGLPSATSHAAVKQGWNIELGHANVNTTGFVNNDRYAVVIMSRGPTSSYLTPMTTMLTHVARLLLPHGRFPAPRPAITGLAPTSVPTSGGWQVVVHGTALTGVTKVLFGTRSTTRFTSVSARELDVIAPRHAAGRVNLRVVTTHGISRKTRADVVRFVPPAMIAAG
jgi:hypothetical protein